MPRPEASYRTVLAAALLALVLPLAGAHDARAAREDACTPRADGPALRLADGRLPNVLLLTVDTLRADHVAYHGGPFQGLTPGLDQLAASSTVFLNATSPAPATRPAMAALMTGSYVGRHRVPSNHGVVAPDVPRLATILKANGYATAGFYGNAILGPKGGFAPGFDVFRDFSREGWAQDASGARHAKEWLAGAPREPWLLWLHLMSPHGPYNTSPPPPPMVVRLEDPLPDAELEPSQSNYGLGPIIPKYQRLQTRRASDYRRRYREEVFFADAQIAEVLAELDARGLRDSTLVVVTADHGESLGEHDYYLQHGWLANEPSLHVPLLVGLPCRVPAGGRVDEPVSLVDVLPTLVAGLGLEAPDGLEGRSLVPALAGEPLPAAPAFALSAYVNQVTALRRGSWKLVHTPPPPDPLPRDWWREHYAKKERWALYDLATDPGEKKDRSASEPSRLAAMRDELARWENANGVAQRGRRMPEVDPRQREMLRALGYVD